MRAVGRGVSANRGLAKAHGSLRVCLWSPRFFLDDTVVCDEPGRGKGQQRAVLLTRVPRIAASTGMVTWTARQPQWLVVTTLKGEFPP